jgi:hypothetical protein
MTWSVIWSPRSDDDRLRISYEILPALVQAVLTWAATGEGFTEPAGDDDLRVRARGGSAIVRVDEHRGAILVLRLEAEQPLPMVTPLLDVPEDDSDD